MRVLLTTVGRLKAGPEREICARYLERANLASRSVGLTGVDFRELDESRARRAEDRKTEEARALEQQIPSGARIVALDERGKALTSVAFAADVGAARDTGASAYVMVIGGADGLDPALRARASLVLAFGAMTWPHQLVRIMAAEQIYRAVTILAGHPYHRS
ncbi:MAG: 23S rRNA (pseudouridine(1915)-N(3))-methyltransferase RlmH [Beijerinckiaceae bacterium]|nr:23S rRNA (pseudouridine(1915)-N(3))-methyltransferase RlmH [Beijerinckiaceae bacterium]MDO9442872.1 23S rRNA (pseudouridine(1915)-N(3))-methyltransferase RlmH [Beijerinckiaceae bacterium]